MLHCLCKSTLLHILEKEALRQVPEPLAVVKVAIVDGMLQSLDKPLWVDACNDLAEHFTTRIFNKYSDMQQIRLIFDR